MCKNFALNLEQTFHSNGKLLLTGEYLVLDGATALAIPTLYGQSLDVVSTERKSIHWQSIDDHENIWYRGEFIIDSDQIISINSDTTSKILLNILQRAKDMNPKFLSDYTGWYITTRMDFPRDWGLGSSSTLINNIAQWAEIDAFSLLKNSFGGSGYDIAVAKNNAPILYTLQEGKVIIEAVELLWNFMDQLFFVHLNQKQDSKEGIARYRNLPINTKQIDEISAISRSLPKAQTLSEFEILIEKHEEIISKIIQLPTIKERLFNDYPNTIKSLGAWGGDFVLATGNDTAYDYFRNKGYSTIIPFRDMMA